MGVQQILKILHVTIRNFRSIKYVELTNLDSLVFLVGRNNAGKSNILRAIESFFTNKINEDDLPKGDTGLIPEISVVFSSISDQMRSLLSLDTTIVELEIVKNYSSPKTPKIIINNKELADYKPKSQSIKDFREIFHNYLPLFYYIPALRNLKNEETWKSNSLIKSLLEPLIKESSLSENSVDFYLEKIKDLIQTESKVMKEKINEFLKDKLDDFKDLEIDISNVNIALDTQLIVTNSVGQLIHASEQGAGTQNFIILALAQYYAYSKANRPLILAFEEPEISLHPQGQRKILLAIQDLLEKSSSVQILLTTHSSVMLGQDSGKIILIRKVNGITEIQPVNQELRAVVDELGITGGDIFQSDALVVIEGRSDYLILREWSKKYMLKKPKSPWNALRITFFHLDGTYGIKEYKEEDFKQLVLCSNLFAVMDSDRKSESDPPSDNILQAKKKIEKAGGKPFILNYRTIESYFDEEIIKRVLNIPYIGQHTPYDEMKQILINISEANGKRYRATIEGRKIAKVMAEMGQLPLEIEQIFDTIGNETAKRVGLTK